MPILNALKMLTGYASLRLTPAEEMQVTEAAEREGVTKSQWLRQRILYSLQGGAPDTRLVLGEMLAFRIATISILAHMCDVLAHTCAGKAPSRETLEALSRDKIRALLTEAEAHGLTLADSKIRATKGGAK